MQSSNRILMVRPASFGFNAETAVSNSFQENAHATNAQELALMEFDSFVKKLQDAGIDVFVLHDTVTPQKPDAIFPNNWFSVHQTGECFIYPMLTDNRRSEVRMDFFSEVLSEDYTQIDLRNDYSEILEGTGSLVLDRLNKIAFACLSDRTNLSLLNRWCQRMNYSPISFHAFNQGFPVYHTNVVMTIASDFVIVCLESVSNEQERMAVRDALNNSGKRLIEISIHQMNHFCGNALEVLNKQGEKYFVCSRTAFKNYNQEQLMVISTFCKFIVADIPTIESVGGGSARCMLAEIF